MSSQRYLMTERLHGTFDRAAKVAGERLGHCVTLASTPREFVVVRTRPDGSNDTPVPPDVYECRWFNASGEVRWVRRGDSGDIAALTLTDGEPRAGEPNVTSVPIHTVLDRSYRVWGDKFSICDGTATSSNGRTSKLAIPVDEADGTAPDLWIHAIELVVDVESSGNLRVLDEMVTCVSTARSAATGGAS